MPSPSTALQRPDLGASLEQFDVEANNMGFIGDKVAPAIDVAEPSMNIGKIPLKALLAERDTKRASGAGYARQNYEFDHFSFATEEHGAEEVIDDRRAKLYARYIDAEMVATKRAQGSVLRNRELRIANLLFNATTWNGAPLTTSISTEWSTWASAVPIADVAAAAEKVFENSGLVANALILNSKVYRNLINNASIIDRVKYSGIDDPKNITAQVLAAVLFPGVPDARIIVAGAIRNSANPGAAASPTRIWSSEYAMVARVANSNDPQEPCVARSFHYTEDGSQLGGLVESYRDDTVRGDIVRVRHETDELVMYTEAAHLLSNLTA